MKAKDDVESKKMARKEEKEKAKEKKKMKRKNLIITTVEGAIQEGNELTH